MKLNRVLAVTLLALAAAACSKPTQTKPEAAPPPPADTATTSGIADPSAGRATSTLTPQQQALAALKAKNVIYFDYDSSGIPSEYLAVVQANAAYLVKYPTARVRLEGNTDERGSPEYNIGLGERRAQTVRSALLAQGVAAAQITTVSYGEERPAVEGHDEAAYAQNRRVEFVYPQ
ncbi:MAG: peptidoglycan-associated lipoprotein Pal [Steroidobacteraceae bacterium]